MGVPNLMLEIALQDGANERFIEDLLDLNLDISIPSSKQNRTILTLQMIGGLGEHTYSCQMIRIANSNRPLEDVSESH